MITISGVALLIALILIRPQELFPSLEDVPLLYVAMAFVVVGFGYEVASQKKTLSLTPVTLWAAAFLCWCFLTLFIDNPNFGWDGIQDMVIAMVLCLAVAHGTQTPRGLNVVAGTFLLCALALSAVGIDQGLSDKQCVAAKDMGYVQEDGVPDGRSCNVRDDCYAKWGAKPNMVYYCEGVDIFGNTSIADGRVRWIGVLHDPNDLALAIGCALPIAYAMRRENKKKKIARTLLALLATIVVLICIILTESRGGQLVIIAVFGTYFLVRAGTRGVVIAAALAVPALLYGGRAGAGASGSTMTRLECWYEGMQMLKANPVFGVGHGMFTEYHWQTAHSAYLLAAAENGMVGLVLFVGALYGAVKSPWTALRRYQDDDDPRRAWAIGVLAMLAGLGVGSFFLSFTYHDVLWLFVGLAGAYHSVTSRMDPGFEVRWRPRDFFLIGVASVTIVVLLYVFTRALG
jgi:hypothetical protein